MARIRLTHLRIVVFLMALILAAQICTTEALAGDALLEKELPGRWAFELEIQEAEGEPYEADVAYLTLEEDGRMSLACDGRDGGYLYTFEGTWSFEYVPDMDDRLTLKITSTDDPARASGPYNVECVYEAYTESWVENDTRYIYLILTEVSCSGVAPFEDAYGEDGAWIVALHREQGPNMKVVKCKEYVSLRKKPSAASARLERVPLGALVLAFPEYGEENGFIYCEYHDEYGYILSEYLQPVE